MVRRQTCAHAILAALQIAVAVFIHGSVLTLPSTPVLAALCVAAGAMIASGGRHGAPRGIAAQQILTHAMLLLLPWILGDGIHLTAAHSWLQVLLVTSYVVALGTVRKASMSFALDAAERHWRDLIRRACMRGPSTIPRPQLRQLPLSERPGCVLDAPFLLAMHFRGPPADGPVPA